MNDEGAILLIVFISFVLFTGDPDLWDKAHMWMDLALAEEVEVRCVHD